MSCTSISPRSLHGHSATGEFLVNINSTHYVPDSVMLKGELAHATQGPNT